MSRRILILSIIMLSLILTSCKKERPVKDTYTLLTAMKAKYAGKWYSKLCFEQNTHYYRDDSLVKTRLWFEAMQSPDKLIVKYDSINSGSGMLFANDTMWEFETDSVISSRKAIHNLLLMSFGVYFFDPAVTMAKLAENDYKTSIFRRDTIDGKEVYVIGALKNDSLANQIWVEKERLLFLGLSKNSGFGLRKVMFSDYTPVEGGGFAPGKITFYTDGKIVMLEEYKNIRIPKDLKADIFRPVKFSRAIWE